jgi:ABC-type multidrug transport system ATPase subunit
LIEKGNIFGIDTPEQLMKNFPEDLWSVKTASSLYQTAKKLQNLPRLISVNSFGQCLHVVLPKGEVSPTDIITFLEQQGETDIEIEQIQANIEDVFMLTTERKTNTVSL